MTWLRTVSSDRLIDGAKLNAITTTWDGGSFFANDGTYKIVTSHGSWTWDVVWPASAVDSNFAAFDTTTGKLIKDSGNKASDFVTAVSLASYIPYTWATGNVDLWENTLSASKIHFDSTPTTWTLSD